ncbi:MAG: hypothetical protein WAU77_01845 [Solirubrobacteraceae bacterium]
MATHSADCTASATPGMPASEPAQLSESNESTQKSRLLGVS